MWGLMTRENAEATVMTETLLPIKLIECFNFWQFLSHLFFVSCFIFLLNFHATYNAKKWYHMNE